MLELARENGASLIYASTSGVYGDAHIIPSPETYWGNVNPIAPHIYLRRRKTVWRRSLQSKTGSFISVELGCRKGGIGAELAAYVGEWCFNSLKAPIRRIAAPDSSFPASKALWGFLQPSRDDIANAIAELSAFDRAGSSTHRAD
jgi:hypothetical protein